MSGEAASGLEVPEPILNGPYDPPARYWNLRIEEGLPPEIADGRRLAAWREAGRPGATRTTLALLSWWERDGRAPRLFFAQREAAETIIFLVEARADFLADLAFPEDDPGEERKAEGYTGFRRRRCKLAAGTGKTTVAAMLSAWSILNKIADRTDARFSDTVLIVCPNITIRSRLSELDPARGE
ncbi:MAG: hypothetical protein ACREFN_07455, partial [Acetobacteraceae bacterium]